MATLGKPRTKKFSIGTSELRVGPLTAAGRLLSVHSVGLVDQVTLEAAAESVDLNGGFPRTLYDTAIVSQSMTIRGTLREYSRRNLKILLGQGISASEPSDVVSTISNGGSGVASGATSVPVASGAGFAQGDLVGIYPAGFPEQVTIGKLSAVAGNTLTLGSETTTLQAYADGAVVFKFQMVAIGNLNQTNYFSAMVIQAERSTGRPIIFNAWKAAIASGLSIANNSSDFASTELNLKVLQPAETEYDSGQPLFNMAARIAVSPLGEYLQGADQL